MTNSIVTDSVVRGTPDNSFGVASKVYLYEKTQKLPLQIHAVCVLPDGGIVCASTSQPLETTYLTLLDARGVVDERFGDAGNAWFKLADFFPDWSFALPYCVRFDAALGKFVVGFFVGGQGYSWKTGLARFDLDGVLDQKFGTGGVMLWGNEAEVAGPGGSDASGEGRVEALSADGYYGAMQLSRDGSAVILTTLGFNDDLQTAYLLKVKESGELDEAFGDGGVVLVDPLSRSVRGEDLVLQGDSILVAGTISLKGEGGWFVARFEANGNLDEGFGDEGFYFETPGIKNRIHYREDKMHLFVMGTSVNMAEQKLFLSYQRRGRNGEEDPHFGPQGWADPLTNGRAKEIVLWQSALYNATSTLLVAGHIQGYTDVDSQAFFCSLEQWMGWDGTFGEEGKVFLPDGTVIHALEMQEDRKFLFISSKNRQLDSYAVERRYY